MCETRCHHKSLKISSFTTNTHTVWTEVVYDVCDGIKTKNPCEPLTLAHSFT